MTLWNRHQIFEKNSIILIIGILAVIAIGGLVEITPLFYLKSTIEKVDGIRPYTPLELAGRNIYVREGCYLCHSQMIRPLRDEVERYGHYSLAAESMYDHLATSTSDGREAGIILRQQYPHGRYPFRWRGVCAR